MKEGKPLKSKRMMDAEEIGRLAVEMQAPVLVIDGHCGSGKTTLARQLAALLQAPVIHMDDFFLPFALRTQKRLSEAGGNVDYERFAAEVLPKIGRNAAFSYGKFDCSDGTITPALCPAAPIRIVEGTYSMHPRFMPCWQRLGALTVFASVPPDEQLRRIALRNPQLMERFRDVWIPMENHYFSTCRVAEQAMTEWTSFAEMSQK